MTDDDRTPDDGGAPPRSRDGAVTIDPDPTADGDVHAGDEIDLTDDPGAPDDAEGVDGPATGAGDRAEDDHGTDGAADTDVPATSARRDVRRVATLSTSEQAAGDRVTTGVLAADATTRVELARRRRWLVGGGVLGFVVVLAYVLGSTLSADQAQEEARNEARRTELAAGFAREVVERAESYEIPAGALVVDGRALTAALEEHLTTTERSTGAIDEVVALTTASLRTTADDLDLLTDRPLPTAEGLPEPAAAEVLTELERLRVEAAALAAEARSTATLAEEWSAAIRAVDAALAAHSAVVAAKPSDPSTTSLAAGWRSEVAPLEELQRVADTAAEVAGLERWAAAHGAYARGLLAFVAEAVPLLEDGETAAYDELYDATFDDDPFELRAEARAGAEEALTSGPLLALAALSQRAAIVTDQVATVEVTVARTLGRDR